MIKQDSYSNYHLTAQPRILFCASKQPWIDHPKNVLRFSDESDRWEQVYGTQPPQRVRFQEFTPAMLGKITGQDHDTLLALHLLRHGLSLPAGARATRSLYEAVRHLVPTFGKRQLGREMPGPRFTGYERKHALKLYIGLARQCMSGARLALTVKNDEPLVTVVCPDLRTAAMVFAVYEAMSVCPACGKVFAPSSDHNQKFCSKNCGQRIYQKRYREREKSKKRGARKR